MPIKSIGRKPRLDDKFVSANHKRKYEVETCKHNLCGEKGFQLKSIEDLGMLEFIYSVVRRRNWELFVKRPLHVLPSLV